MAGRAIAAAALTCIAVLIAGCGNSPGPAAAPPKPSTVPASPASATTAPATAPTSAPDTTPAAPPGPGPCPTRSLQAKLGLSQGAAGSVYTVIDFTNISTATCTLYGYPGVSLAGGKPITQIGLAAAENPATARQLVTLQPNVTANALLRVVNAQNFPAARCHPVTAHYLQIYPPNQTTPVYLRYRALTCAKPIRTMTVDVVKPGSGGS